VTIRGKKNILIFF